MTLPARAAALRGDDYQHVIGLYNALRALNEPDIESVNVEDADGGAFDDIVVRWHRRSAKPDEYFQVKSSNYNNRAVDEDWLVAAATAKGRSPLQHFHDTWRNLNRSGESFTIALLTNRNFDHHDRILSLIDNTTDRIAPSQLDGLTANSAGGQQLTRWAAHLGVSVDELKSFLTDVTFLRGEADHAWEQRCRPLMRTAGLRDDDDAVTVGRAMVRSWVTGGRGPLTRDDIRAEVTARDLLARDGTLVLAVHAIDRSPLPDLPNVTVDIVDLYPQTEPWQRRQLTRTADWQESVQPRLRAARDDLSAFRTRRVHVVGAMRLPLYFAVGRALPDVAGWVLSVDQRGSAWSTDCPRVDATLETICDERLGPGADVAVVVALTLDPVPDVRAYLAQGDSSVGRLLVLTTPQGPRDDSVPGSGWAMRWVELARQQIAEAVRESDAHQVHLFMACPAGVALFLGHRWNTLPTTTVYEHVIPGYEPTITFAG